MKVAFIGCGNMGSALAKGMSGVASLVLFDRHQERAQELAKKLGGIPAKALDEAVRGADFVVLAIKPKDLAETALALNLDSKTVIVSLLAGVSLQQLREKFPNNKCVRAMPNLAVGTGQGVTGLVEDLQMSPEIKQRVSALFAPTGLVLWLPENKIDALMSLTACAPAFIAYLIEAFTEGGIHMGFSADQALPLVLRVFEGTLAVIKEQGLHPAVMRWKVASPGGTTIEGLKVLEEHRIHYAIMAALDASLQKSKKLTS
jgi:pyrroline-5-carboxylate reductase